MALDTTDPNAVRQAAKSIVGQSQFTSQRQTTWERVLHYATHPLDLFNLILGKVLDQFLESASHAIVASILSVVVAAIIVFVVIRFAHTTSRNSAVHIHYAPVESGKSVKQLLSEADALERDEKWRDAIRLRYAAMVQELSEKGIVRARQGRTTGEYVSEVNVGAPAIAQSFASATRIFEWVWYGSGEPGRDDAAEFKSLAQDATQKAAA